MGDSDSDWEVDAQSKFQRYSTKIVGRILKGKNDNRLHSLRWYQLEAVLKTQSLLLQDKAERIQRLADGISPPTIKPAVIVAPTGAGKSGMIVLLPYFLESSKVLVITPSKVITTTLAVAFGEKKNKKCFFEETELCPKEPSKRIKFLNSVLEEVKVIQTPSDISHRGGNLVIVNAQKFGGRSSLTLSLEYQNQNIIADVRTFFEEFDTLIIDEAHHYPAQTWVNIVNEFSKSRRGTEKNIVFLTATPNRLIDGREEFILGQENKSRIAYEVSAGILKGTTIRHLEFREPTHEGDTESVYKDVLKIFEEHQSREPRFQPQAMILVRTKPEVEELVAEFNRLYEPFRDESLIQYAVSFIGNKRETSDLVEKFTEGKYRVAVTCGVALEGYDNANVTLCIILTKIDTAKRRFEQFVGRCMRIRRGLEGDLADQSIGTVLSYPEFAQRRLFNELNYVSETDPAEIEEEV